MSRMLTEESITASLKSLGFAYECITYCGLTETRVALKDIHLLIHEVQASHYEMYANKKSVYYIKEIDIRKDMEQQQAYMWLIDKEYNDFFLLIDLPLIIQFYIDILNLNDDEEQFQIGELMYKIIEKEAKYYNISYDEMAYNIRELYGLN